MEYNAYLSTEKEPLQGNSKFKVGAAVTLLYTNNKETRTKKITKITKTMFWVEDSRFYIKGSTTQSFLPVGHTSVRKMGSRSFVNYSLA